MSNPAGTGEEPPYTDPLFQNGGVVYADQSIFVTTAPSIGFEICLVVLVFLIPSYGFPYTEIGCFFLLDIWVGRRARFR